MPAPCPLTEAERAVHLERVAVARCICRNGKWPTHLALAEELRAMNSEIMRGAIDPAVNATGARQFLVDAGLPVPPKAGIAPTAAPAKLSTPAKPTTLKSGRA